MDKLLTLNALYFALIATAGIVGHVVKKWSQKQIEVSVYDWFASNPQSTVAMFTGVFGSLALFIANDQANDINNLMQVMAVFGLGYMGNSAVNKQ